MTPFTRNVARPLCVYRDGKTRCQSTGSLNFDMCMWMMVHGSVASVSRGLVVNCWFVRAGIFCVRRVAVATKLEGSGRNVQSFSVIS